MFYEAEATYSSFLKCFCVHHQPHSIPVRKSDEMPSKTQPKPWSDRVFWSRFWLAFWGHFIGFTVDNIMWLVVNTKTLQKWRVCGLSFIKHQKVLKNSTWAWSYGDLKNVRFFLYENRWYLCWPKIWQWYMPIWDPKFSKISKIIYMPIRGLLGVFI